MIAKVVALIFISGILAAPRQSTLKQDLQDIFDALPVKEIENVINDHLEHDAAFAAFIQFMKSKEWTQFEELIFNDPVIQDFFTYLEDSGVPVRDYIQQGQEWLKNAHPKQQPSKNGCLTPLIEDIIDVLPTDKFLRVVQDKLMNSSSMKEFYDRVSSNQMRRFVDKMNRMPKFQALKQRLKHFCIDVDKIFDMVKTFLGW